MSFIFVKANTLFLLIRIIVVHNLYRGRASSVALGALITCKGK